MMQASSAKDRLQFIDAIRAYAILMMLQGHFVDTMLAYRFRDLENALYSTWFFMRGMTAPIFFTVTGLVFTFLLLRDGRPIKENERIRKGIRRGFFLIFLGYLFFGAHKTKANLDGRLRLEKKKNNKIIYIFQSMYNNTI